MLIHGNDMLKNLCKVLFIGIIGVTSLSAEDIYPQWLTDIPKSNELVYGIGVVELTGTNDFELKKVAYYRALNEIALSTETKVESLFKEFVDTTGIDENTVETHQHAIASNNTAYGIGDIGKVENEYATEDGNYFILVSTPVQKIKMDKSKPIVIKSYVEESRESKNGIKLPWNTEHAYSYSSKGEGSVDHEEFIEKNAVLQQKEDTSRLPEWAMNPQIDGIPLSASGGSGRYKNESLFVSLQMALAQARVELAKNLGVSVDRILLSENVANKQITSQTLKNSEIYKIYIDDSQVYVLVGINNGRLNQTAKLSSDNKIKADKAAWEAFKKQKAQDTLGKTMKQTKNK